MGAVKDGPRFAIRCYGGPRDGYTIRNIAQYPYGYVLLTLALDESEFVVAAWPWLTFRALEMMIRADLMKRAKQAHRTGRKK